MIKAAIRNGFVMAVAVASLELGCTIYFMPHWQEIVVLTSLGLGLCTVFGTLMTYQKDVLKESLMFALAAFFGAVAFCTMSGAMWLGQPAKLILVISLTVACLAFVLGIVFFEDEPMDSTDEELVINTDTE